MRERWPWLAVLAAVLLTGFFLPDLSLAIQDRRVEDRAETRAADSPVLVHKAEEQDNGFVLDDMEIVREQPLLIAQTLTRGRELDFDAAMQAALPFLESMAVYGLVPEEMTRDIEVSLSPKLLCTEDARIAVIWEISFFHNDVLVRLSMDDREGRLLAFSIENHLPDNVDAVPEASVFLDRMLRFCQENCAPLTCERAAWQDVGIEEYGELDLRTAFQLSDGAGRVLDAEVFIYRMRNDFSLYSFNS